MNQSHPITDSISSDLCLSCGLCCDGTVIGYVQLTQDEMPALKKIMEVEDMVGNGFFLQPCSSHCNGCSVYAARPKQCASYKCDLLKSVEERKLGYDAAINVTEMVKQLKKAIEKNDAFIEIELQSKSFYFKMIEMKKLFQDNMDAYSLTSNQGVLQSDLNQLDHLLSTKFGVSIN